MQEFDAIVVGAGQAGSPLAHSLADEGWKVALIERDHLGGSCINYGCTPTKAMIASARVAHSARDSDRFGVDTGDVRVELDRVIDRKDEIVQAWRQGQQEHAENRPSLHLYRGTGRFAGAHTVEMKGERLVADLIFINTGTRAALPPIDGLDQVSYLTNKSILELRELPEHLLVIGGSYIGLEFGQMFHRFGSQVTIVEMSSQIAPTEDADVAASLQDALEAEGLEIHLSSLCTNAHQDEDGQVHLAVKDDETGESRHLSGSHLLLATGRVPNTDDLNLAAAGVEHVDGWIPVDEHLQTNVEGIYALGDVNGGPAFTHISYNDFQIVLHNLLAKGENRKSTEDRIVPYAMFTEPELGRVGLTERQARQNGHRIKAGSIPMDWVARAIESGQTKGMMKVVIDAETDRLLGAAVLGPGGAELVQTLMSLMMTDAPWTTFKGAVFIHPTLTEGFFTLMDNVE